MTTIDELKDRRLDLYLALEFPESRDCAAVVARNATRRTLIEMLDCEIDAQIADRNKEIINRE